MRWAEFASTHAAEEIASLGVQWMYLAEVGLASINVGSSVIVLLLLPSKLLLVTKRRTFSVERIYGESGTPRESR